MLGNSHLIRSQMTGLRWGLGIENQFQNQILRSGIGYQFLCAHILFLGGEKGLLKMYLSESLNHSFKRFIQKHWFIQYEMSQSWASHWIIHSTDSIKTLIHPVTKRVNLERSHWIIHSRDSFKNTNSSSNETSQSWVSHWIIHSRDSFKQHWFIRNGTSQSWAESLIIHSRDSFKNTDSSSNDTRQSWASHWIFIQEIHSKTLIHPVMIDRQSWVSHWINSFKRFIQKTLIHPVMKRVNLEWVTESLIQEIGFKNTDASSN